jgi:hypothetical protein
VVTRSCSHHASRPRDEPDFENNHDESLVCELHGLAPFHGRGAGRALGGLVADAKYASVSGKYFDGFREIPSSAESRDKDKAKAVWEQSIKLAGLSAEETSFFPADPQGSNTAANYNERVRPGVAR